MYVYGAALSAVGAAVDEDDREDENSDEEDDRLLLEHDRERNRQVHATEQAASGAEATLGVPLRVRWHSCRPEEALRAAELRLEAARAMGRHQHPA